MNRRNFMKTFALAVGVSPLALAGKPAPEAELVNLIQEAIDRGDFDGAYVFYKGQPMYHSDSFFEVEVLSPAERVKYRKDRNLTV